MSPQACAYREETAGVSFPRGGGDTTRLLIRIYCAA